jgi:uncharacterized protein with NAD-binding domain and iron-sulfur cluster
MPNSKRSVAIVGGGLAGMVAGLRLIQMGCDVTIYESDVRLGGKAGSIRNPSGYDDHGYHIFPMWYLNIWDLVEELGIRDNFVDRTDFLQLKPHEFPKTTTLRNISSTRYAWYNLTAGVLPFLEMALVYYFGIDLMATPLRQKAFLDQITVNGFIRSRFYRTEALAEQCQDLILKGISTPSYFASAMTMRTVLNNWAKYPEPMCRVANKCLQEAWIGPIAARLESLGCRIQFTHRLERLVVDGTKVAAISLRDLNSGEVREVSVDLVLLAVPAERVYALLDEDLFAAAPELAALANLEARSMAGLDIYLKNRIPELSTSHTNLLGSQYGLSFIDVSRLWPGHQATALNAIASDCHDLLTLPSDFVERQLLDDLRRFLPSLDDANIERIVFQPHVDAPLLMNNTGMWTSRPGAKTSVSNLFLAGDYCRTNIDLVCMEGAVTAGLHAAEAVRNYIGAKGAVKVRAPVAHPRWIWVLGKWLLVPFAAVAKLILLLQGLKQPPSPKFSPRPPTEVN